MSYKHLFGPVQSRRLGYSLGVDLVPYKYCPLNCVYCEVQQTTHLTLRRREFFPVGEITSELDDYLNSNPALDYITFSGAGEPTLYSKIGEIISFIKTKYPQYKLALLTNGVLLNNVTLRKEILSCDLILPSLDAATQDVYLKINRPHRELQAADQICGLAKLRNDFKGQIWLEVFIIAGINDNLTELDALCKAINVIQPDRVQLNSLDRPGAEEWVVAASSKILNTVRRHFTAQLSMPVDIIAKSDPEIADLTVPPDIERSIAMTLLRRPGTAEDISSSLCLHINEISKYLRQLKAEHKVRIKRKQRGVFYSWIH